MKERSPLHASILMREILEVPREDIPDAVDALCDFLGESRTDGRNRSNFSAGDTVALSVINSIGRLELRGYFSKDDNLVPVLKKQWARLFRWMQLLLEDIIEKRDPDVTTSEAKGAVDSISLAICSISSNAELARRFMVAHDVVKLAARFFLLEGPEPTSIIPYGSYALGRCIHMSRLEAELDRPPQLDVIVEAAHGSAEAVAEAALLRLRLSMKSSASNYLDRMEIYSTLVSHLLTAEGHPISQALLHQHAIAALTKTALVASKSRLTKGDSGTILLRRYFGLSRHLLQFSTGTPWVLEAIHSGLLQIYCHCSTSFGRLGEMITEGAKLILTDFLPKYLAFHTVLTAIVLAFKRISPSEDLALRRSAVGAAWLSFTELILERLVVKQHFDRVVYKAAIVHCNHVRERS